MPGYILHLTAAKMALDMVEQMNIVSLNAEQKNAFLIGNLLPDTVKNKEASHFRNPKYKQNMVEYPDLKLFRKKYLSILSDSSCLGYYLHLYIDRKFFKEYLPSIIQFLNAKEQRVEKLREVVWVEMKRTGERISKHQFYSEEYYYGDYTRMNTYLIERYQLSLDLNVNVLNPGIEEVNYGDIKQILDELRGYLQIPASAVKEVKVFDVEEVLQFLEKAVQEFVIHMKKYAV